MKPIKSSNDALAIYSLPLIAALIVMPQIPIIREAVTAAFAPVCYVLAVLTLLIILPYMRSYELTEEGITHRFLGIRLRHTVWPEVRDAARFCINVQRGKEIFLATGEASPVRPQGNAAKPAAGHPRAKAVSTATSFAMWQGRVIVLRNRPDIVQCVERWHGKLDFDE